LGTLRDARIASDDAGVSVVMEAGERKGGVNEVGSEAFPSGAVVCRDAISLVGGKAGMVEAVEDVDGGLADAVGGEITGGRAVINGTFTEEEAGSIAKGIMMK